MTSSATTWSSGAPASTSPPHVPERDEGLQSTRMPQSAAMNPIRATGAAGSSGTYAAPAFIAPYRATTASSDFSAWTPTRSPRRTPAATSRPDSRPEAASSSP